MPAGDMTADPTRKAQTPVKITLLNGRHPNMTMPTLSMM